MKLELEVLPKLKTQKLNRNLKTLQREILPYTCISTMYYTCISKIQENQFRQKETSCGIFFYFFYIFFKKINSRFPRQENQLGFSLQISK